MILGVVSDTHNRVSNVEKIIDIFNSNQVDYVIHTGDITRADTLNRFSRLNSKLIAVLGNNDLEELGLKETWKIHNFILETPPLVIVLGGKKIAIFHEPDGINEFIAKNSSINYIFHGHTHRYRSEEKKGITIFNPGESAGMLKGKNAVGLIDLKESTIKRIFF